MASWVVPVVPSSDVTEKWAGGPGAVPLCGPRRGLQPDCSGRLDRQKASVDRSGASSTEMTPALSLLLQMCLSRARTQRVYIPMWTLSEAVEEYEMPFFITTV